MAGQKRDAYVSIPAAIRMSLLRSTERIRLGEQLDAEPSKFERALARQMMAAERALRRENARATVPRVWHTRLLGIFLFLVQAVSARFASLEEELKAVMGKRWGSQSVDRFPIEGTDAAYTAVASHALSLNATEVLALPPEIRDRATFWVVDPQRLPEELRRTVEGAIERIIVDPARFVTLANAGGIPADKAAGMITDTVTLAIQPPKRKEEMLQGLTSVLGQRMERLLERSRQVLRPRKPRAA